MGLKEDDFWRCTPRYFENARKGLEKKEQIQWEQSRLIAYYSFMSYPKKNPPKMDKLIPFPWEIEKRVKKAKAMRFSEKEMIGEFEKFMKL